MITRRYFLASTAVIPSTPYLAFADDIMGLRAEPAKLELLPNKDPTSLWGFNGSTSAIAVGPNSLEYACKSLDLQ